MERRVPAWIQINAALARPGGSALPAARAALRAIDAALPVLQRQRLVTDWFFQRKPPDLRLRFRTSGDGLLAALRPLLVRLEAEGHIRRSFLSTYEPETRQFGGRACMGHVHRYWSRDSRAWIARDRLVEVGAVRIPHAVLMSAAFNDLFWTCLEDGGEVWDTWCNLLLLLGQVEVAPRAVRDPPALDPLIFSASPAEAAILKRQRAAGAKLAAGLRDAWGRGRMQCGIRTILPHVAMFSLNRHGFDRTSGLLLAEAMAAAWHPKPVLRGAACGLPPERRTG